MNREVLDRWCQRGILGLVLAVLVFGPLATGAVRSLEFLILQGLTVGVVLLWGLRLWVEERPKLLFPPICWAVLAFVGYAIGRYLTADIEYVARQELIKVLVYACLFFAILNNLHRQEHTQILSFTLVFLAMAISGYAVYQFVTGSDRVWNFYGGYHHRGSGTYISPNHLGGFLEMLLPLALAYVLVGRLKPLTKVLLGYAALVMLVGIAVTLSRGSWIASGAALALLFVALVAYRPSRVPSLVLLVILLAAGCWVVPKSFSLQARWRLLFLELNESGDMRFALWRPAVQIWQENPWWGAGPAHFDARFPSHRPVELQLRADRVHNDYLNTLTDWGVVGAALVASAWGLLGLGVIQTWRSVGRRPADLGAKSGSNKLAFLLGGSFGLLALLLHSFVDFNLHIPANAILATMLMALLSSQLRFTSERYWTKVGSWTRVVATLMLLAGAGYLSGQAWRHGREYVWLERASRVPEYSPAQAELLGRAFQAEPKNGDTAYALGEAFRVQSLAGGEHYRDQTAQAMQWFERGMKLNPWDSHSYLGYGSCLDWLERFAESPTYFSRAEELDPNGYFTVAKIGLHYMQTGDYAAARPWFERSRRLQWEKNPIAHNYLELANRRLLEAATNSLSARLDHPQP
jgi:O-antigen ligase